jgi:hypothetical protein
MKGASPMAKINSTAQESQGADPALMLRLRAAAVRTLRETDAAVIAAMPKAKRSRPPIGKRVAYEAVDQLAGLSAALLQHVNELDAGDDEVAVLRAIAVRMVDLSNAAHVALTVGAATAGCERMVLLGQPWA